VFSISDNLAADAKVGVGDVIVFKYPKNTDLNYIKRLVGLPGDTIQVIDKVVYVNDEPIKLESIIGKKYMDDMDEKFKRFNLKFFKTKTGEHDHITQIDEDNVYSADFSKIIVPKGHYFVMGDNRDVSGDSRYWGFLEREDIAGTPAIVTFSVGETPINSYRDYVLKYQRHLKGKSSVRWERTLKLIK
jgi:signal peptidase I